MFLIGTTFLQLINKVLAAIYRDQFFQMLEMIASRRIRTTPNEEKAVFNTGLFNELTEVSRYSPVGLLKRTDKLETT